MADDWTNRVMALWDQKLNTVEIAKRLKIEESYAAELLRIGREERRKNETAAQR